MSDDDKPVNYSEVHSVFTNLIVNGTMEEVKHFIFKHDIQIDYATNMYPSAMLHALYAGNIQFLELLLQAGAKLDVTLEYQGKHGIHVLDHWKHRTYSEEFKQRVIEEMKNQSVALKDTNQVMYYRAIDRGWYEARAVASTVSGTFTVSTNS